MFSLRSFNFSTILTFFIVGGVVSVKRWKRDITVIVEPGIEDCYYIPNIQKTSEIDIAFEVRPQPMYFYRCYSYPGFM